MESVPLIARLKAQREEAAQALVRQAARKAAADERRAVQAERDERAYQQEKVEKRLGVTKRKAAAERSRVAKMRGSAAEKAKRQVVAEKRKGEDKKLKAKKRREQGAVAAARGELPKVLPGFEFVEVRKKARPVFVPNARDYSDVFENSKGLELEYEDTKKLEEQNRKAAEHNKKIEAEEERNRAMHLENAKKDFADGGRRISESRWVAIDANKAAKIATAKLNDDLGRSGKPGGRSYAPAVTSSRPSSSGGAGSSRGAAVPTARPTKTQAVKTKAAETESKAAGLFSLICKANGKSGNGKAMPLPKSSPKSSAPRRKEEATGSMRVGKGRVEKESAVRIGGVKRGSGGGAKSNSGPVSGRRKDRDEFVVPKRRDRAEPVARGRSSGGDRRDRDMPDRRGRHDPRDRYDDYSDGGDDYEDDDDDDDDDDDNFGSSFADVQNEELEAERIGRLEDKAEKKKIEKARKEKLRRKEEWARRNR